MRYGCEQHFTEIARFERRLSLMIVAVAAALLGVFALASQPAVRRRLPLTAQRFGFEGRDRYVQRIMLETLGPLRLETGHELSLVQRQATRGGVSARPRSHDLQAQPETRARRAGPGESSEDLLTRAREIYRSAPVVQSEDLVIEHLVKPQYPEDARNRNIEGKVAVVALVDTTGSVTQVDVIGSTGERQLEKAATEAVWQCRFRPYRVHGEVQQVYAMFRFAFRIY
jgi:TonB family protein